jgi:hydroxymethylpyrimidine pyrophosphatase-like HAD family hydrolase
MNSPAPDVFAPTSPAPRSAKGTARRLVLTDFDGTFAEAGGVPDAHVQAARALREAGHLFVLATGRPRSIVSEQIRSLFDGVIASAGCHVEFGGIVLQDRHYPPELTTRALAVLREHDALFALEATEAMWVQSGDAPGMREAFAPAQARSGNNSILLEAIREVPDPEARPFAKIFVQRSPVSVEVLAEAIGPGVRPLPSSLLRDGHHRGELQLSAVDKADGLHLLAEHLGIPVPNTIAVGDGLNDLGMLEAAGVAVGISGGAEEVARIADLMVPGPTEGGFARACERLDLLSVA